MIKSIRKGILLAATCFGFVVTISFVCSAGQGESSGLYWYGRDTSSQKFVDGEVNQFYDANKPTVIFIHGWQPDYYSSGLQKADFLIDDNGVYEHTQNSWIDKGWNVGIYHWEEFADEDDVQWAEAKIWSTDGPKEMRYRLPNGEYQSLGESAVPVAEAAYADVIAALRDYCGGNLRLVGHSLGNQMVNRLAELIHINIEAGNIDEKTYRVQRIALLDPAWTKDGKEWLGDSDNNGEDDWVGERCRWAIEKMISQWTDKYNFVVEVYSTTGLDLELGVAMDANEPLRESVCNVSLRPWYMDFYELAEKHSAAITHYFLSMESLPPVECNVNLLIRSATGNVAASASTSEERIKQMMGGEHYWDQVEGRYTETSEDDWFEIK